MPSEKKSKKHKAEKGTVAEGQLKPLAQYVDDRLELTKQLFSCLKTKQIKQRLPANLQNKSIERIQQICLDEILGISTKRLVSIINNTTCPENTDSDDSEIDDGDEHLSMEEISSDSDAEKAKKLETVAVKKPEASSKKAKESSKTPKEMTMLQLLELQARARAIRSQLALEPVTKIELDESDEEAAENGDTHKEKPTTSNSKASSSNGKRKSPTRASGSAKKVAESKPRESVVPPPPPSAKPAPTVSAKPVKLKRNYKSRTIEVSPLKTPPKEEAPPVKGAPPQNTQMNDDDDDDVITMHQSPETFFISDSDDEPPQKKSPVPSLKEKPIEPKEKTPEKVVDPQTPEEGEISECEGSPAAHREEEPPTKPSSIVEDNGDDVIHLMSDTEIDLHHNEDEDIDEPPAPAPEVVEEKSAGKSSLTVQVLSIEEIPSEMAEVVPEPEKSPQKSPEQSTVDQFDEDVVEIHNSSDDEMLNESDEKSAEDSQKSQTWEQRWLSSSKTQKVLKTTQLASKVRENLLKTKKSKMDSETKRRDSEKAMKEKVLSTEEGSLEQFKVIKDNSESSVN